MKYTFLEYINAKNKIQKPIVDELSKGKKHPLGLASKDVTIHSSKTKTTNQPFGDTGDPSLKTKFDTESVSKPPAKIPIAEQIGISNTIIENCSNDPSLIETIVRQMKKSGLLSLLVAEVFEHPESYHHIGEIMAHNDYGPGFCSKLVKAMQEQTGPAFSAQLDSEIIKPKESQPQNQSGEEPPQNQPGEEPPQPPMMNNNNMSPEEMMQPKQNMQQPSGGNMPQGGAMPQPPQSNPQNPLGLPELGPAMQNMQKAMMRKYMFKR